MKATGIIRRIDELGRIVIPKEIRKTLKISEGENIEIYIDEEEKIILKKYSNLKNIKDFAQNLTDSIYNSCKCNIIITDMNNIVAASGNMKKDIIDQEVSDEIINIIKSRKKINNKNNLKITSNFEINCYYLIDIIISNGDINGSIILLKEENEIKEDSKILTIATSFLSKYLEE